MGDSGSDAGARIHASFRPLHRAAAGRLRTIYKKASLFSSSRPSTQLSWTAPTGSITSHTPLINPALSRTEGARDSLARGRQGA